MKSITNFALSFSILVASTSTFAAQDRWTEGYGQGNLEHFIDKDISY